MPDEEAGSENAWSKTLTQLRSMEAELEDAGWEVVGVPAGDVAPEPPAAGDSERFGFVYVVPGNVEAEFRDLFDRGEFPEYEVYRREVGGTLFLITKLTDPNRKLAILIAGGIDTERNIDPLVRAATEAGEMYTHVQLLDRTHLGSFRHDDPTLFFPD